MNTHVQLPTSLRWQVRLLGGLTLLGDDERLHRLPSRPVAALLARFAMWPERTHAREELVELLWPGVALDVGRNRLRQALSALKAVLEPAARVGAPVLQADRLGIRVVEGALACDVRAFEQAVHEARHADARRLYAGELLPGYYDGWIADERLRLAALRERVPDGPVERPAALPAMPARSAVDAAPRDRLPAYLTRAFGTGGPLAALQEEALAHRLVTLLGPGGCGKTRLAVALAQSIAHGSAAPASGPQRFDRVVFVGLVACTTRGQALDALLAALHAVPAGADVLARAIDVLDGRRMLLVLDNFEQLVGIADDVVARLAASLPLLHVVVTSRRALALDGAREFAVAPLDLPEADAALDAAAANPAVALFVDRARAVRADFRLGPRNRAAVVALVRALEGLPLAIELAASRLRTYAPDDMLARIAGPQGVLALLARSGQRSGFDPRHASMQRVIEWSWRQLQPAEQRLAGALTVFRGGAAAPALASVDGTPGGDAHAVLDALVAQSFVHARADAAGDAMRFHLYEPIREYVAAQVDAPQAARWRAGQRTWAIDWAAALLPTPPLPALRDEMPNLAAALASAAEDGAGDDAARLLLALGRALEDVELPAEALAAAGRAVEGARDALLHSRASTRLGLLFFVAGDKAAALRHAEQGLRDAPPGGAVRARALHALARLHWRIERSTARAMPLLCESEALGAAVDDRELRVLQLSLRATMLEAEGADAPGALRLHRQALALAEPLTNRHAVNAYRYSVAAAEEAAGRHAEALEQLDTIVAEAQALEDWRRVAQALNVRGNALSELRRWPEAAQAFRDSLRHAWRLTALHEIAYPLWNLPRALAHLREPEPALEIASFVAQFWQARFGALSRSDRYDLARLDRLARRQRPAAVCAACRARGERLALADAVRLALAG